MTDQSSPITPPPELLQQLSNNPRLTWLERLRLAYAAGADQELEACIGWFADACNHGFGDDYAKIISAKIRAARRPKPPSLKERIAAAITEGDERTALLLLNEALPND